MPLYRVDGEDGYSGTVRTAYIHAPSKKEALRTASKRSILNGVCQASSSAEVPEGAAVIRAEASQPNNSQLAIYARPIRTIALGVFLGLLLWTAFGIAVSVLLSVLGIAFFGGAD